MNVKIKKHHWRAIDDTKQAELDRLHDAVIRAEFTVNQWQAVVEGTAVKQSHFESAVATAKTRYETALSNFNLAKQVVAEIIEMVLETVTVAKQTTKANNEINNTAEQASLFVNQLIFSVEVIDKLAFLLNKKKASKVLISEELVEAVNAASRDANSAVALSLTALDNCFTTTASSDEAETMTTLERKKSLELFLLVVGDLKVSSSKEHKDKEQKKKEERIITWAIKKLDDLSKAETSYKKALGVWEDALGERGVTGYAISQFLELEQEDLMAKKEAAKRKADELQEAMDKIALSKDTIDEYKAHDEEHKRAKQNFNKQKTKFQAYTNLHTTITKLKEAQTDNHEAEAALAKVIARPGPIPKPAPGSEPKQPLYWLLQEAKDRANEKYKTDQLFLEMAEREHELASKKLQESTVELNALKAGHKAALAAALAA